MLVLGGGYGGVATAWALTRTPEHQRAFDVTIVHPIVRLGDGGAIRRNGVHAQGSGAAIDVWLGCWRDAFAMMRDAHEALDGPRGRPPRTLEDAFTPVHDVELPGGDAACPDAWRLRFQATAGRPWDARTPRNRPLDVVATWARRLREALLGAPGEEPSRDRLRTLAGLTGAVLRGLSVEQAMHGPEAFDRMDELDLRQWLRAQGASAEEADAPPIRALYAIGGADEAIAAPSAAAGVALRLLLQVFGEYRGAPLYRMPLGVGATLLVPLRRVLRARGSRFSSFRRIDALRVTRGALAQVELAAHAGQANDQEALAAAAGIGGRSGSITGGAASGASVLRRGEDFDDVVLAIPPSAHPHLARELIAASPRYRAMVEAVHPGADPPAPIVPPPGTTKHRLAPDESGFEGLFLAGAWTKSRNDAGGVEAAVASGVAVAEAIARRA